MGTLSYYTNQSFSAIAMKNIKSVEANTKNISAKSQPSVPYGFRGDDFYVYFFFLLFAFMLP